MPMKQSKNAITSFDSVAPTSNFFFKGSDNLTGLDFDPLVTGYAFIFWTKLPMWVRGEFPNFKSLTEKNFKSFQGLSDIDLQTAAHTMGFNANEYNVATSIQKANTEFSLRHAEFSGSPIKQAYQYWVSGIRDPQTGIATYPVEMLRHGAKAEEAVYAAKNHTGELMYVVTRPDADNAYGNNIEFAAYYTNVMPRRIPIGHFNYDQGSQDLQVLDIDFVGNLHMSPAVDEYAKELLKDNFKNNTGYRFETEEQFIPRVRNSIAADN